MLTEDELAAIEARCNAATSAPWAWDGATQLRSERAVGSVIELAADSVYLTRASDCEFIAHARTDVPKLAREVRRQRAELEKLREHNEHVKHVLAMIPKEVVTESVYQAMQDVLRAKQETSDAG